MPKKIDDRERAMILASKASCDPRTAQSWIEHPESVRPQIAKRLEKAASDDQDQRPWLVDAEQMKIVDDLVELVPKLVQLSTTLANEIVELRAEVAELRGEPSREQPKRKNARA